MASALYILHWPEKDIDTLNSEILLHREYLNDLPTSDIVWNTFNEAYRIRKPEERSPFILSEGINYIYIKGENDLIILAVTRTNINCMLMIVFLDKLYGTLHHYFSKTKNIIKQENRGIQFELHRDIIVDNCNLIFELLDECMDFGIVQVTDYNILKEYIKLEAHHPKLKDIDSEDNSDSSESSDTNDNLKVNKKKAKGKSKSRKQIKSTHNQANKSDVLTLEQDYINSSILKTASLSINWRPKGIFYAKNEIYVDMIESCEFHYDLETNSISTNYVYGMCVVKCYLSGMPVCKIGFNEHNLSGIENDSRINKTPPRSDNQLLESQIEGEEEVEEKEEELLSGDNNSKERHIVPITNVQFHQCIELDSIYNDNIIRFIPPDDKFVLFRYNVEQLKNRKKKPLIMIKPIFRISKSSKTLHVLCILDTSFRKRLHALNVSVKIPIPPHLFKLAGDINDGESMKFKAEAGTVNFKVDSSEVFWTIPIVKGKSSIKMVTELLLSDVPPSREEVETVLIGKGITLGKEADNIEEDTTSELDEFYGVNGKSKSLLASIRKNLASAPLQTNINVSFSIPMLLYSGLKLNYLRVDEDLMKYTCFPWVRYCSESIFRSQASKKSESNNFNGQSCNYSFRPGISNYQFLD